MSLFGKSKKYSGWMVISFHVDGVTVAYIKRPAAGKPIVEIFSFFPANGNAQSAALEKLTKALHTDRYQCAHLLSSGEYQLLSIDAITVQADELKQAVRWRLKTMLDYHIDDATIDVLAVPTNKSGPLQSNTLFAVAAHNTLIQQRQELFEAAKIGLNVIDIPEMAQRNISALLEPEDRAVAMLSFDNEGGLITFTFGGELYLSRRIEMTANELRKANKADIVLLHQRITLELQRSLDHFDRQYHAMPLSKLVLAPLGPEGIALQAYLAENLYIPVDILTLKTILDLSKVPQLDKPEIQQRHFMTLGAALRLDEKTF